MATAVVAGLFQTSCLEEYAPGSYYTFTGNTVASFLIDEERAESFTDFVYILKTANVWGELSTYGDHTCFAPTNDAIAAYLAERGYSSVQELPVSLCDTIAKTHLCTETFYCKDLDDGIFPAPNLLDRYLSYSTDSAVTEAGKYKVVYKVNKSASLIERDDTVQNGVVHIIDQVISPSNAMLPDLIKEDPTTTLFYEALALTSLDDSLTAYLDITYPTPDYDSTLTCLKATGKTACMYDTGAEKNQKGTFPEKRYFKFTALIPQDSVLAANYNVTDLDGLRALAQQIYGDNGSEYNGAIGTENDTMFTKRTNSLNKFISYHLLPEQLSYNRLNFITPKITIDEYLPKWKEFDVEDFYETMMPHSLIRISTPYVDKEHRYINRKGIKGADNFVPGVMVIPTTADATAANGEYHYMSDILKYDDETRSVTLNTRIRVMTNTLSPDFTNSNATGRVTDGTTNTEYTVGFKKGYAKNFVRTDATQFFVRYANPVFSCYMGYEMTILGIYDIAVKLPPVPTAGTYEIRNYSYSMQGQSSTKRGTIQVYFLEGDIYKDDISNTSSEWKPCGIPVDLGLDGEDPKVGNVKDSELNGEDEIATLDKAMRARGYMKGMDSFKQNKTTVLRDDMQALRKILTTEYMVPEKNYWIRIRVCSGREGDCAFNCMEIVPKSIYAGDIPEDRH